MPPGSTRPRGRPRTLSAAEALLWSHLRCNQLEGWHFFRRTPSSSSPAGPATTFVCPDARVSIEIDASSSTDSHSDAGPLTFTSFEVLATTEAVLSAILVALRTALTRRRTN